MLEMKLLNVTKNVYANYIMNNLIPDIHLKWPNDGSLEISSANEKVATPSMFALALHRDIQGIFQQLLHLSITPSVKKGNQ